MNILLARYAKERIKEGLLKLPESHQVLFKRMYSHKDLELPIDKVVDNMPKEKLNWALTQVENSLKEVEYGKEQKRKINEKEKVKEKIETSQRK